jgi:beta-lactamase superfamily II metal-dependent hydrolase
MYRIGHGDCFLLAFPGAAQPVYVLIDCGYKPGSPQHIKTTPAQVCAHLRAATGGHIDVAIVTHEHQDHVNAITKTNFTGITIGECWLAWTENPNDKVANALRTKFKDQLLGLMAARNRLGAEGDSRRLRDLDRLLAYELGGDEPRFDARAAMRLLGADGSPLDSRNKQAMKLLKDRAARIRFIQPHQRILGLPKANDVRVFALGPPRDPAALESLDPEGNEGFPRDAHAFSDVGRYFASALGADGSAPGGSPFDTRYAIPWKKALRNRKLPFLDLYGVGPNEPQRRGDAEVLSNAEWRRIDEDWLYSAGQLALDMNNQTNNSSLVLAFELGKGGKVLLFAADAQRGNWVSWSKKKWKDGDDEITAQDLLGRTVLYKVGHHGSHNATLKGTAADAYANLSWMADGDHAREFTAMITAVRAWAETQDGWDHPLEAIKEALLEKAAGRVFQTDTDWDRMAMADGGTESDWKAFEARTTGRDRLYFDYVVSR